MTSSSVIIIGAGFGGVAAAIELLGHGFTDVTLLEAAPRLGGTWHYNRYPGAACDVPSHLYSYSYAQRASWSRFCSPQEEILGYLDGQALACAIGKWAPRPQDDAVLIGITRGDPLGIEITPLMPVDERTPSRTGPCKRRTDCCCSFEKGSSANLHHLLLPRCQRHVL